METIAEKTAECLLEIKAISFRIKKPFRFTTGLLSPIYIDNRLVISYPVIREKILDFYIQVIKKQIGLDKIQLISGTATAAIPYAAFIAQKLHLPMVYVRKTAKAHGKTNQIEGLVKKGQKTLIIEDHISTGSSTIANALAIRNAAGVAKQAIGVTTYNLKVAEENFQKANLSVYTLTDFVSIIKCAIKNGYLRKKEEKIVSSWVINPKQWAKKHGFE
jgi:orotate phosphoribosyltransferase